MSVERAVIAHGVLSAALATACLAFLATEPPPAVEKAPIERAGPIDRSRKLDLRRPVRTDRYEVTFLNVHSRELFPVLAGGGVQDDGLREFLRCRATGQTRPIDPRPFEVARTLAQRFSSARVEVVSGYRSPKFNEQLRKKGRQVASRSHHTLGEALDFRLPDVDAAQLAAAAEEVHVGGIGTYRTSGFVHVDVGRDRRWGGR